VAVQAAGTRALGGRRTTQTAGAELLGRDQTVLAVGDGRDALIDVAIRR
jgi:hypothetical protein